MKLWIVIHHNNNEHKQHVLPIYQELRPTIAQQEEAIGECGFDESGRGEPGEWLTLRGPFLLPVSQPLRFALVATDGQPIEGTVLCSACALGDDGASLHRARSQTKLVDEVASHGDFQPCDPTLPCSICQHETQRCDWGHEAHEIRKLPSGDGNMLLCRKHYSVEAKARAGRGLETPAWETLEIYVGCG